MSSGLPKPLIITLAPWAASALAMARPIPLVDPVTTADLDFRLMAMLSCSGGCFPPPSRGRGRGGARRLRRAADVEGAHAALRRALEELGAVAQGAPRVRRARLPVLQHHRPREVVVLDPALVGLVAVDQLHHADRVL